MNSYLITVDAGTTNTRAILMDKSGECRDVAQSEVGVRNTAIDGNNSRLKAAVKDCMDRLLVGNGLGWERIAAVYASGMITSNVGLTEIPHLAAPAGMEDFVRAVRTEELPDVCAMPMHFIPGLKNIAGNVDADTLASMDIMRGEEVEVIAILDWCGTGGESLFVLPGSHSKFVTVDRNGTLTGCLSSIAGELLAALTNHSILADAVGRNFVGANDYNREWFLRGFHAARETSFARAAFSTRILNLFVTKDTAACANFLMGAVLEGDLAMLRKMRLQLSPDARVVVAGRDPLRRALVDAFNADGYFRVVQEFMPPPNAVLSAHGAYLVAKAREGWR